MITSYKDGFLNRDDKRMGLSLAADALKLHIIVSTKGFLCIPKETLELKIKKQTNLFC